MPLRDGDGLVLVLAPGPCLDGPTVMAWLEGRAGQARGAVLAEAPAGACRVEVDEFNPAHAAVQVGTAVFWISAEHTPRAREVIRC
jgi:plastocyanin